KPDEDEAAALSQVAGGHGLREERGWLRGSNRGRDEEVLVEAAAVAVVAQAGLEPVETGTEQLDRELPVGVLRVSGGELGQRLPELVAMQDRLDALPPLLEKVQQGGVRSLVVEVLELVEDARRSVDAEAALAGAHGESDPAADVVETGRAAASERLRQMPSRD